MLNKKILLIDESFDSVFFENYNYYVYLYHNKLIVLFLDNRINKFIYFVLYEFSDFKDINNILEQHYFYNNKLKNKFFYTEATYFFIPESFFKSENLNHIYYILSGKTNAKLFYTLNNDYKNYIVYEPIYDLSTLNIENSFLIRPTIMNCIKIAEEFSLRFLKNENILMLNFSLKKFDVIVINNNNLLLSNNYEYNSYNDVLYYIFYIINTLKLNHKKLSILFNGEIEKKNQLEKKLYNYNFKVSYTKLNKNYLYSYRFNELKAHKFADLFYPVQ
ncbi:MAG: DUF3822 family protein [Bacteroidales bacterium]|nr:DUF3822 family protein [Bacteroidales bacterium]